MLEIGVPETLRIPISDSHFGVAPPFRPILAKGGMQLAIRIPSQSDPCQSAISNKAVYTSSHSVVIDGCRSSIRL